MLACEQVSVISNLKGTKECRNREKAVKQQCNDRVLVPLYGVYIIIYLWVLQELRPSFRWRIVYDTDSLDFNQLKLGLWWPLSQFYVVFSLKSLHKYACILSLKLPQLCSLGRFCFARVLVFLFAVCVHVKSLHSYLTLCDPMDCCVPNFSVHGILQERTLEWVVTLSPASSNHKSFLVPCSVLVLLFGITPAKRWTQFLGNIRVLTYALWGNIFSL